MWFVYLLRCADNSLYVGQTNDVAARVVKHAEAEGGCRHTAQRRPVRLVYSEMHETRADALQRERQIKRWTRRKKEALVIGDLTRLKSL